MTPEQTKIADYLRDHKLTHGIGSEESPCTIAAINLALSGKLTDGRPDCVCPVIHAWAIPIQDAMPLDMLNGEWREMVPLIAGTSADNEAEEKRRAILIDWMFGTVLPQLQSLADEKGFGKEWATMCEKRTVAATYDAKAAANAAYAAKAAANAASAANTADAAAYAAAHAAKAAANAASAAHAAKAAANAASAADAAKAAANAASAAHAAKAAANAAADAADAAAYAANAAQDKDAYWRTVNPAEVLKQLIAVKG